MEHVVKSSDNYIILVLCFVTFTVRAIVKASNQLKKPKNSVIEFLGFFGWELEIAISVSGCVEAKMKTLGVQTFSLWYN